MFNIGIIGFGKMGKIRVTTIESLRLGNITAIYEPSEDVPEKYHSVNHVNDIFNDSTIDVVFVCTPNKFNKEYTIRALNEKKHVFCEKPPAFTASDINEIIAAEKRSNCRLMYGFNHRHHESIMDMKRLVENNDFGKILWMRGRYGKSVDQTFYENWRSNVNESGGGILMDQGIHMLDLFLHLSGEFDQSHAFLSNLYWKLPVEDNAFVILKNSESGTVASLHSTMTQWRHLFSLEVFLEKGYMVLNGLKTSSNTYGDEVLTVAKKRSTAPAATWEDEEHTTYTTDKSWENELIHFFDAIHQNKPILTGNSADALKLMTLMDNIYAHEKKGVLT